VHVSDFQEKPPYYALRPQSRPCASKGAILRSSPRASKDGLPFEAQAALGEERRMAEREGFASSPIYEVIRYLFIASYADWRIMGVNLGEGKVKYFSVWGSFRLRIVEDKGWDRHVTTAGDKFTQTFVKPMSGLVTIF
jgi:hypothetical protein